MRLRDQSLTVKPRVVRSGVSWFADRINPATGKAQTSLPGSFDLAVSTALGWAGDPC
ncbi:conserved hypothetical protein [Arthrobacter sp. 9V]|nr:conserved hypothetical protein [Arthrobacter sp. 9V]